MFCHFVDSGSSSEENCAMDNRLAAWAALQCELLITHNHLDNQTITFVTLCGLQSFYHSSVFVCMHARRYIQT